MKNAIDCFVKLSIFVGAAAALRPAQAAYEYLHEGDLLFVQSQSSQAPALREITGSPWTHLGVAVKRGADWYIVEAENSVQTTPIAEFIARAIEHRFIVKRVHPNILPMNDTQLAALKAQFSAFMGLPYDVYFEWADDAMYCSELIYKSFDRALQVDIGQLQHVRDFPLDGPEAQLLIRLRFTRAGKTLNPDEIVVTPISMMNDPQLDQIYDSANPTATRH